MEALPHRCASSYAFQQVWTVVEVHEPDDSSGVSQHVVFSFSAVDSMRGIFRLHAGARDHVASGGWPVSTANLGVVDQSIVEVLRPSAGDAPGIVPVPARVVVHGGAAWEKAILRIE